MGKPAQYLDVKGVHAVFLSLGFSMSERQVRRMLDEDVLPMFTMRGKRARRRPRYISRQVLDEHIKKLQDEAIASIRSVAQKKVRTK